MAGPTPLPDTTRQTGTPPGGQTAGGRDHKSPPATPRWVKLFGISLLALILLVVIVLVVGGGNHGPARHLPSGDAGNYPPPTLQSAQQP